MQIKDGIDQTIKNLSRNTRTEINFGKFLPVSMMMEDSGNLNLSTSRYFMHLASLMHPLSSFLVFLYDTAQITARFGPWTAGGGPGGA